MVLLLVLLVASANAFDVKTNMICKPEDAAAINHFANALNTFDPETTYSVTCGTSTLIEVEVTGISPAAFIVKILNWELSVRSGGMRLDQRTITTIDGIELSKIKRRTVLITRDVTIGMVYIAILYHLGCISAIAISIYIMPTNEYEPVKETYHNTVYPKAQSVF